MDSKPHPPLQSTNDDAEIDSAEAVAPEPTQPIQGSDIANILGSKGPVVKCVVLRSAKLPELNVQEEEDSKQPAKPWMSSETATVSGEPNHDTVADGHQQEEGRKPYIHSDLVEEIRMDTTPSKNEVSRILGGAFTFVGQYEDEGIVLMARRGWIEEDVSTAATLSDNHEDWNKMSVSQLRSMCRQQHICMDNMIEKDDLIFALTEIRKEFPPFNPHPLQPPFHDTRIRGDILVLKVAHVDEPLDEEDGDVKEEEEITKTAYQEDGGDQDIERGGAHIHHGEEDENAINSSEGITDEGGAEVGSKDENETKKGNEGEQESEQEENDDGTENRQVLRVPTNNEFFLDYTKGEYLSFASRTDIVPPTLTDQPGGNEDNGEDDNAGDYHWGEDMEEMTEDEEKSAMLNIVMSELLRKFREENGRGPETRELLDMRAAVAEQLGVEVTTFDDAHWEAEEARNAEQAASATAAAASLVQDASRKRPAAGQEGVGGDMMLEDISERKRVKFGKQLVTSEVHIDYSEEAAMHSPEATTLAQMNAQQSFQSATDTSVPNPSSKDGSPSPSGLPKNDDPDP